MAQKRDMYQSSMVRQNVAQTYIEAQIFRLLGLRNLTVAMQGRPPGPSASLTKLFWSEMDKRLQETAIEIEGMYGALAPGSPYSVQEGRWQLAWMWAQAETIYAGSSEIQRNIIAERVLGLPRSR
jgi:alkylation response protein AidB-like acyl-CoA dehydrogenase